MVTHLNVPFQFGSNAVEDRTCLSDSIYEALKADVISHRLPPGTLLLEKRLADRFEVSRTPVREALRRLEQDGLVTIIARKGAFIPEVSLRDTLEIDEIRLLLEGAAARKAAARISLERLDEIEAELDALNQTSPAELDFQALIEFDQHLHDAILTAAGNRWLREMGLRLYNIIHRIRGANTEKRYLETVVELRSLVAALRSRDADAADKAMREHISFARFDDHSFR